MNSQLSFGIRVFSLQQIWRASLQGFGGIYISDAFSQSQFFINFTVFLNICKHLERACECSSSMKSGSLLLFCCKTQLV